MQNKTLPTYFLLLLLAGSAILAFYILKPFLGPLVLATIFAVVLQPVFHKLTAFFGNRPSLASLATIVLFAIVVLLPVSFIASRLFIEAQQVYAQLSTKGPQTAVSETFASLVEPLSASIPGAPERIEQLRENFGQYARSALNWVVQHLGSAFSGLLALFLNTFIFFVALYYLLRDGRQITRQLVEYSPLSDRDDTEIVDRLGTAVNSVIRGQLAIALIQGTVAGIGFAIFGVPNAVLWGTVTAIAALIPSIGTALVLTPAVVYLALTGSLGGAVGLAVWGAAAVGLVDNLLGPRLIGAGLHLHPLLVILAVIGGVILFGPIGIFLGPLTMSLLFVLLSIHRDVTRRAA
jgi:predicted PurR-regulated permease PerM